MTSRETIRQAIVDPSSVYASPDALVADPNLDRSEKLVLLSLWEADARELAVAEEENMGGGEDGRLGEIRRCLHELGGATQKAQPAAGHKQGPVFEHALDSLRVRHFIQSPPENVHPDMDVAEARRRLEEQAVDLVVVTDGTEVVGMLTGGDLDTADSDDLALRTFMNVEMTFCYGNDSAATALDLIDRTGIPRILVIERDGILLGTVGRDDLPAGADRKASHIDNGHRRERTSGAVASTIQPGGLEVYSNRPKIRLGNES